MAFSAAPEKVSEGSSGAIAPRAFCTRRAAFSILRHIAVPIEMVFRQVGHRRAGKAWRESHELKTGKFQHHAVGRQDFGEVRKERGADVAPEPDAVPHRPQEPGGEGGGRGLSVAPGHAVDRCR